METLMQGSSLTFSRAAERPILSSHATPTPPTLNTRHFTSKKTLLPLARVELSSAIFSRQSVGSLRINPVDSAPSAGEPKSTGRSSNGKFAVSNLIESSQYGDQQGKFSLTNRIPQLLNEPVLYPKLSSTPFAIPDSGEKQKKKWHLDKEIDRVSELISRLSSATTTEEKDLILSSDKLVLSVFGSPIIDTGLAPGPCRYVKPIVSKALSILSPKQVFLLKCLVACGQEHLLDIPVAWNPHLESEFSSLKKEESRFEQATLEGNALKDALSMIAQMIEGWDASDPKSLFSGIIESLDTSNLISSSISSIQSSYLKPASALGWDLFPMSKPIELVSYGGQYREISELRPEEFDSEIPGPPRPLRESMDQLMNVLSRIDRFYDSIGGVLGYQLAALELMRASEIKEKSASFDDSGFSEEDAKSAHRKTTSFHMPVGRDLASDPGFASQAAVWGLQALPLMGEIYPLGGAGDRLGLVDESTGECLPVAMLPYCGRTLLEGLIRDLQAREYLHFMIFGEQHVTPIAIMTSSAKQNHRRVCALCESHNWFGRGSANFKIFEQPLVPTVTAMDGKWLSSSPLDPILKPGGHGALWKLAYDNGAFEWFRNKGRRAAIVRQISNPLAGTDVTLLALSGTGIRENKKFGFASCDRNVGTAEGVNVVLEKRRDDGKWEYCVTCVEYTEFEKLGIHDLPVSAGSTRSRYPANTNVLFVNLNSIESIVSKSGKASIPGLIMNLSKPVKFVDWHGLPQSIRAGRLECTMQNIADSLSQTFSDPLPPSHYDKLDTYVLFNDRSKVTSSAKKKRNPNDFKLHQTPDGSFLDLTRNARQILRRCGVSTPDLSTIPEYIESGPSFIFLFHPALGPLWDVIAQKIRGGSIGRRSYVQLEVAELYWHDVNVNGSLRILAQNVMGHMQIPDDDKSSRSESILHYGHRCGRCFLHNVSVVNQGINWDDQNNVYWQNKVSSKQELKVVLNGMSEFYASNVRIEGSHTFEVPDGYCMKVSQGQSGQMVCELIELRNNQPSWSWNYEICDNRRVELTLDVN